MENKRRKKATVPIEPEDNSIPVRVSPRSPRTQAEPPKRSATPPMARAHNLATAMLETLIGQLADYIENSHAVEKLIRAQTTTVLRELAHDPQLAALIRSQAEQYLADLVSRPEILEPLVIAQVDRYLEHLTSNPDRLRALASSLNQAPPPKPPSGPAATSKRRKPAPKTKIPIE